MIYSVEFQKVQLSFVMSLSCTKDYTSIQSLNPKGY